MKNTINFRSTYSRYVVWNKQAERTLGMTWSSPRLCGRPCLLDKQSLSGYVFHLNLTTLKPPNSPPHKKKTLNEQKDPNKDFAICLQENSIHAVHLQRKRNLGLLSSVVRLLLHCKVTVALTLHHDETSHCSSGIPLKGQMYTTKTHYE